MRLSYVLLMAAVIGCGGGGSGEPTGTNTGNGTGTGPGTGTGTGSASGSASVAIKQSDDGYGYAVFSFSPATVTITKGGTVTWSNEGGASIAHNITFSASGAPANAGNFSSGSVTRTFNNTGTFSYQCTNHSGMSGTVTVQ